MTYQTKYHSTGQMRNAIRHLTLQHQFKGLDEEGNAIYDEITPLPTVEYVGTVKLHGTNANIVLHDNGEITFHSKEQYLAKINTQDEFELGRDNAEFAQTMYRRSADLRVILYNITEVLEQDGSLEYPIKLSGEWCGSGIQKGVGVSFLNRKSLFVFGVKVGDTWRSAKDFRHCFPHGVDADFYNIHNFVTQEISIDLNRPEYSTSVIGRMVEEVEEECLVAKALGVEGGCLVGEGYVWTPKDPLLFADTGTWFKTKGQKHSVSKVKKLVSVCPEKLESIDKFVEYAVTENRLEQGLSEVGLDQKKVGEYIGWVNRDINNEEGDVLESNNLTMKDIGKYVTQRAREFYLGKLNEF